MQIICKIDGSVHDSLKSLHKYLRFLKTTQESYYHEFTPRRDKLTNELIPYKDYQQYHTQEFSNKNNLKKWIKENKESGIEWSTEWLKKRKIEKNLIYAPSQTELRTLVCPSIPYYESNIAGGYYELTSKLGFLPRYDNKPLVFSPISCPIIQDTREQKPLILDHPILIETLNVGDYALSTTQDVGIRIERKSLGDFCGTLNGKETKTKKGEDSSIERFRREIKRGIVDNLYIIMMVESDINDAQRFNYLPQTKHVKASPGYIMKNMRDLLVEFPLSLQIVFVAGRIEMASKLVRILQLGKQAKTVDLQYRSEKGEL